MPRRARGPAPGKKYWFTPAVLGNDKDPDPVRFYVCTPSKHQRRAIAAAGLGDGNSFAGAYSASMEEASRQCCFEVKSYEAPLLVDEVQTYKALKDGDDLAVHGETEFLDALYSELMTGASLDAQEKKHSSASSDSTSADTKPSNGTAGTAESADSAENGDARPEA